MQYKIGKLLIHIVILLLLPVVALSQASEFEQAVKLFDSGNFANAGHVFKKLVLEDTSNAKLNYYYGACLAEQGIFSEETNQCLLKAVSGDTPDKVFYYVGQYFQSRQLWGPAIKYYERFKNYGSEEEKKLVDIDGLIKQCYNKANPQPGALTNEQLEEKKETIAEEVPEVAKEPEVIETISFQVNSKIAYLLPGHFQNKDALNYYKEGIKAEEKLEKVISESDSLRRVYSQSTSDRALVSERILELELKSYSLRKEADRAFSNARMLEQGYWENASQSELKKFTAEINRLKAEINKSKQAPMPEIKEIITKPEILVEEKPVEKPQGNVEGQDKIVFKIQIGAYSRSLPDYVKKQYKKLSLIREIDNYTDDRGITVFTTGNLTNFEDAVKLKAQVRQEGVKDAFIVAYKNGKRIRTSEAKALLNIKK